MKISTFFVKIILTICLFSTFVSCQEYEADFTILRFPQILADVEGEEWRTTNYSISNIGKIVQHPGEAQESDIIYDRLVITGFTGNRQIEKLQIVIDVSDLEELRGVYTTEISDLGRLVDVEWIMATSPGADTYRTYQLCDTETAQFEIERQNRFEYIITGSFNFTLCRKNAPENTLEFANGRFRDISYE
ncbi:MAG: hypothetical protein ACFCUU_05085 [Cyclobacteriaceae bacterium]